MDIRGGAMINRSEIPDDLIQGMVDSALEAYHTVFPKPGCDWEAFHAAIGGEKLRYYRVGKAWNGSGCDGQIGAFVSLENAIDAANRIGGVTVYDWDGRVMYVAPEKASKGAGRMAKKLEGHGIEAVVKVR